MEGEKGGEGGGGCREGARGARGREGWGGTLSHVCAKTQKDEHEADYVAGLHKKKNSNTERTRKKEHGTMSMQLATWHAYIKKNQKLKKNKTKSIES